MMKKCFPLLYVFVLCVSVSLAGYSDGYISTGEYEYGVEIFHHNTLVVDGGGADVIDMRNSSYLQVLSTSIPVNNNWNTGGITDIWLFNYSHLDYFGGSTEEITIGSSATAVLKGGRIDAITSLQNVITPSIDLYCQPGWEWIKTGDVTTGITGLWLDGTTFDIQLINDSDYDETWKNINVIPEPATIALLSLGGLLIRKRK